MAIILMGVAWHLLIKGASESPRLADSIRATGLEVFVDATIPTGSVGGELLRIAYARNKMGVSIWSALAAAVVLRVLVAGVLSSLLAIAAYMGLARLGGMWLLLAASITAIIAVAALSARPAALVGLVPARYRPLAESVLRPLSSLMRSKLTPVALAFVAAEISSSATTQVLAFLALGYRIPYYLVLLAYPIYDVLVALPTGIPGSFGIADVGTSLIYASFGVAWSEALAAMIATRVICLIADAALGLPTFVLEGRHLAPPPEIMSALRGEGRRG